MPLLTRLYVYPQTLPQPDTGQIKLLCIASPDDRIAPTPFGLSQHIASPHSFDTHTYSPLSAQSAIAARLHSHLSHPPATKHKAISPHSPFVARSSTLAMAAVVAPQHAGLWQRRTDQAIHIPNINMSGLMPSYDTSSRTVTNPPNSRPFQPTTSHMDLNMPLFSTHPLTTSVPYQSGAFAFDSLSVNPYNMQQAFPVSYPPPLSHAVTYPGAQDMQPLPTVREARNGFPLERTTPPVKTETSSPIQPNQLFTESAYSEDYKPAASDSAEANINFSTDVDTLMKAIQAKQQSVQQRQPPPAKVRELSHHETLKARDSLLLQEEEVKPSQKPKKRYQCSIPGCNKSFYQKTHLEIHTRAHTGVKPFVSVCLSSCCFTLTENAAL